MSVITLIKKKITYYKLLFFYFSIVKLNLKYQL
jgi:hypothetical protein